MNLSLFALVLATGLVSPSNEQVSGPHHKVCPARCESGWTYFDKTDSCYKTFFWETFDTAESLCRSVGAHLTSIHSADENHFVADMSRAGMTVSWTEWTWIGLKRAHYNNKKWLWTDGTNVDFTAWSKGEPDHDGAENCGQLASDMSRKSRYHYRHWNDIRCDHRMRAFVCKKKALH